MVAWGLVVLARGARAGSRIDLALLLWFGIVFVTVTAFLPLAWDRYLLPLQAPAAVVAAVGVAESLWGRTRRAPS
jgi:hypothetical protein